MYPANFPSRPKIFDWIRISNWWRLFHYFLFCKILCPNNSWVSFHRLLGLSLYVNIHFETMRQRVVLCQESLVHKIEIMFRSIPSLILNGHNYCLVENSCTYYHTTSYCLLLLATNRSKMDKNPSCGPSIKSIKCYSRFVPENYIRNINVHEFQGPILTL